jgi:hypothetical protein
MLLHLIACFYIAFFFLPKEDKIAFHTIPKEEKVAFQTMPKPKKEREKS